MPKLTQKDGELRIYDGSTTNYYLQVLFTQGDFSAPLARPHVEEMLNMDRGNFDQHSQYYEGPDDPVLEPLGISFSAIIDSSLDNRVVTELFSGSTQVSTTNAAITDVPVTLTTSKASSTVRINGADVSTVAFGDSTKTCYNVEILWDQSGSDIGVKYNEVYFPPGEQTISESADAVTLSLNGMWYGSSSTIAAFTSGTSI